MMIPIRCACGIFPSALKSLNSYLLRGGEHGKPFGLASGRGRDEPGRPPQAAEKRPGERFPVVQDPALAIWACIRRAHVLPFGKKSGTPQAKVIVELTEFVLPTLVLLLLLQVKHVLADFILTSAYIIQNRWIYGHPGGLLHVAIHLAGSLIAFLIAGLPGLGVLLILLIGEAVLHYHIDWTKDNLTRRYALTPKDAKFWWAMGIDQFLHQATYLVMAGYWAARVLV
jgi:hypothetical protein